ncbi:hypothetical protein DVH24_025961 [Malus domestica]|uniref:RNase H type-1 domain-containing protein n=1 Tax=Malus domestica TaxID=3750 RepID=A0A498KM39_MALDO|nr:hypothetical protein DVH24_025961 [Malus domestica]
MTRCRGLQKIMVEGDSKLILEAVQGTDGVSRRVRKIIDDIKLIAKYFDFITWDHVYREANFVVDAVTDVAFQFGNLHIWDRSLSPAASSALSFDRVGLGCTRGFTL